MVKNAQVFQITYEDETQGDLYAVSLVDSPANGLPLIALSKEAIKLRADDKKKILYGVALRPDQKIYREFEDGTPYYITFDAKTIERLSQDFLRKGYQSNSNYNHNQDEKLSNVTVVENWIVEDPEKDKLAAIGFSDIQKGDWAIGMKVSDEVWENYVETGKVNGFSIEAFLEYEKIKMKATSEDENINQINKTMKKESLFRKFLNFISEVKMETYVSDLGPVTADALEVGMTVYTESGDPLVSSEFIVDNMSYKTDEFGVIAEIAEVMPVEDPGEDMEDVVEEPAEEETPAEEAAEEVEEAVEDMVEEPAEEVDVEALKAKIAELEAEIEKLTKSQEDVLMENTKLKAMEASRKIPAESKEKTAPIALKKTQKMEDSALDAISKITKKLNK